MLESVKAAVRSGLGRIVATLKPLQFGYAEELRDYVEREYQRRRQERRPWELQWRLNLAFVDGNQYLDINAAMMSLVEVPKLYWWQEREVFNHIAPIMETRIARISRMQPTLKVRPATGEAEDLSSAKVSARLLEYVLHERLKAKGRQTLIAWMELCGTAFLKNIWDPTLGNVVGAVAVRTETDEGVHVEGGKEEEEEAGSGLDVAGKEATRAFTEPAEEPVALERSERGVVAATIQPVYEGDVNPVVVPPFEVFPDSPWHSTIEECRSILHARAYHVDQIYEIWGVRVEPEPAESHALYRTTLGLGGLGYGFGSFFTSTTELEGHAVVKELWERPSMKYPDGRYIVVAGGKVLHVGPLPFRIGSDGKVDLPFVKFESIVRPGCFWGRSVIERLIPIQRRYNALRNRKAEYLNRCAIGQYAIEDGSVDLDDVEENAAAPGHIFVYKKGSNPPVMMQNPSLPSAFDSEEATLLNEFTIISGVSEIARHSQAPPGVKSGVALSIAVEQDDTRLSHTVGNLEAGFVEAGRHWLRLYKQYATTKRLLRTVGTDLSVEIIDWDASDIRSDDVVVETSAMLAESPAQRRQMVFDLLAAGLFNDPETGRLTKEGQAKVLELLQFGHWEFGDDTERLHINRADRENRLMANGQLPSVAEYDDDIMHLRRHTRFRLTSEYEDMVRRSGGEIDRIFQEHTTAHLLQLQQKAIATQQMAGVRGETEQGG